MAYLRSFVVPGGYVNYTNPDGSPRAIAITGQIEDDSFPGEAYVGTCWIEGPELAALPPADPELDGTPDDPRYQAIMATVARFIRRKHAEWRQLMLTRASETVRPEAEIDALPEITPAMLQVLAPEE